MKLENTASSRGDFNHVQGSGSHLLNNLEDRVNHTLNINNNLSQGIAKSDAIKPEDVRNYISQISSTPLPGMSQNFVV